MSAPKDHIVMVRGDQSAHVHDSEILIWEGQGWERSKAPAMPAPVTGGEGDDVTALRAEYQERAGKKPYMGWSAETLREKIAAL